MRIMFWNTHKQEGALDTLPQIAFEEDLDIIALAELDSRNDRTLNDITTRLNRLQTDTYTFLPIVAENEKVFVFYRKRKVKISNAYNERALFAKKIVGNKISISIIFCHLVSKNNISTSAQAHNSSTFVRLINEYEKTISKDDYTIICGDFNMNPYEEGVLNADSFNAMMDRDVANSKKRTIEGNEYKFFYNPMWSCLGDISKGGAPGTFYYNNSLEVNQPFWNMLDQVIMRPDVIPYFDDNGIKIITNGLTYSTATRFGHPNENISDHFPILFTLKDF